MEVTSLLDTSRRFFSAKDPRVEEVGLLRYPRARQNECYNNAFLWCSENRGYSYVLGIYFMWGAVPIEHAWVCKAGKHSDVTIKKLQKGDVYVVCHEPDFSWVEEFTFDQGFAPSIPDYVNEVVRKKPRYRGPR